MILLGYALWHGSQIFRVDPAVVVAVRGQGTVLPIIIIVNNGGDIGRSCNTTLAQRK
jgi:hypothetical protein